MSQYPDANALLRRWQRIGIYWYVTGNRSYEFRPGNLVRVPGKQGEWTIIGVDLDTWTGKINLHLRSIRTMKARTFRANEVIHEPKKGRRVRD